MDRKRHSYDNFEEQWVEQDAIIRNLEVIGEASVNVSDDLKVHYPDVGWKEMRGMRNFVTHEYFGVSLTINLGYCSKRYSHTQKANRRRHQ